MPTQSVVQAIRIATIDVEPRCADLLRKEINQLRACSKAMSPPFGRRQAIRSLHYLSIVVFTDHRYDPSLVIEATGWTPPTINRVLADVLARPLTWNLVVSNVPGPQMPFYLLGRRMLEVYPFVPLSPQGHALSIGVVSYDGGVFFGVVGDRALFADIDDVARDLERELAEQLTE